MDRLIGAVLDVDRDELGVFPRLSAAMLPTSAPDLCVTARVAPWAGMGPPLRDWVQGSIGARGHLRCQSVPSVTSVVSDCFAPGAHPPRKSPAPLTSGTVTPQTAHEPQLFHHTHPLFAGVFPAFYLY